MPAVTSGAIPGVEDARSTLLATVRQLPLNQHFSKAALKAADNLVARRALWQEPLIWYQPPGCHSDALQHELEDLDGERRVVTVYLYRLFGEPTPESVCTCGLPHCAHACALLLALQGMVAWPRAMTPLERWRRALDVTGPSPPAFVSIRPRDSRELICLIDTDSHRQPASLSARLILVASRDQLSQRDRWLPLEALAAHLLSPEALKWQVQLSNMPPVAGHTAHLLEGPSGSVLFAELMRAGRCFHAHTLRRLRYDPPQEADWSWTQDAEAQVRIALVPLREWAVLVELGGLHFLDEESGAVTPLKLSLEVWGMLNQMPPISPHDQEWLTEWPPHPALGKIPPPPPFPALQQVSPALELILVLKAARDPNRDDQIFYVLAYADYGGWRLPLAEEPWKDQVIRRAAGHYIAIRREVGQELSAIGVLMGRELASLKKLCADVGRVLSPTPETGALGHREYLRGGKETFTSLTAYLQALGLNGFRVEYDPDLPFTILSPDTRLKATLSDNAAGGWAQFELAAMTEGGAVNLLPAVLEGLRRKDFSLTPAANENPDAHWLAPIGHEQYLPLRLSQLRDWLSPLLICLRAPPRRADEALELSRSQAVALADSFQSQQVPILGARAATLAEILATLRTVHESTSTLTQPAGFRGVLRGYQLTGLNWLQALRATHLGGILADDMGLGKTIQIIAHLLTELEAGRLQRPALIVVPTSLVFNWRDELARFAPALHCLDFTGSERRTRREDISHSHVVLISYSLLPLESAWLESLDFSLLVLDEAQWIKNPFTQSARTVRSLRASHRIALTGTPLENHLGELWALMDVVMPGLLGDYRLFTRLFRIPIEREDDDVRLSLLRQRVAPFLLRRTKAAVAPELPPKTEAIRRVVMLDQQRRLYESLRLSLSREVRDAVKKCTQEQSRIVVLSALLRLRQVCCDPRLVDEAYSTVGSAKLEALMQLTHSLRNEGRQVLVFSQFTTMLDWISRRLAQAHCRHGLLTGQTVDRAAPVRRFQSGEVPILLASLKAGGVGLNLTGADAVIQYDPWWNPAVESQAVDRAHRLGREAPVHVYKLICEDTIEEKVESLKGRKSHLASALLDPDAPAGTLTNEDLMTVFDLA